MAWLLGIVGTYTIGAFVHVLLVLAIVLFVVGLLSGRRSSGYRQQVDCREPLRLDADTGRDTLIRISGEV